jgi:hypothetical protein
MDRNKPTDQEIPKNKKQKTKSKFQTFPPTGVISSNGRFLSRDLFRLIAITSQGGCLDESKNCRSPVMVIYSMVHAISGHGPASGL